METNDSVNDLPAVIISEPVRVDIPTSLPPPPHRSRSKTIYLDTILSSELRDELTQDRDELSPPPIPEECSAGFFRINAKAATGTATVKQNPWAPSRPSAGSLPLIPIGFEPHPPQASAAPAPERMQLALTSILKPEPLSEPRVERRAAGCTAARLNTATTSDARVVGFLVPTDGESRDEIFVLRIGRSLVTSDTVSATSHTFVIENRSVSPGHATIKVDEAGQVQVLDQFSEHGTTIRRHESGEGLHLSATSAQLFHGDEVSFGSKSFNVCLLASRK